MKFVCIVWISEQTVNSALHNIKRFASITKVECLLCGMHRVLI